MLIHLNMRILSVLLIIVLTLLANSCMVKKEMRIDEYFEKWHKKSRSMADIKPQDDLERNINELSKLVFCSFDSSDNAKLRQSYPKLQYQVFQGEISVTKAVELPDPLTSDPIAVFKDSTFVNRTTCSNSQLAALIVFDEYKNVTGRRLRPGFGSSYQGRNNEKARTLLASHHSAKYFTIPFEISSIVINESLDSAIVYTSTTYEYFAKRYIKDDAEWRVDTLLYHLME